jgi:hypothetical protein
VEAKKLVLRLPRRDIDAKYQHVRVKLPVAEHGDSP